MDFHFNIKFFNFKFSIFCEGRCCHGGARPWWVDLQGGTYNDFSIPELMHVSIWLKSNTKRSSALNDKDLKELCGFYGGAGYNCEHWEQVLRHLVNEQSSLSPSTWWWSSSTSSFFTDRLVTFAGAATRILMAHAKKFPCCDFWDVVL